MSDAVATNKKVVPVPKYMSVMSPEGWARQAGHVAANGKNLHWTTDASVELPIKLGLDPACISSRPPMTVMELFAKTVQANGNEPALRVKRSGVWRTWTWTDFWRDCERFAKAAIATGLPRHGGTCIIGFNSPEWVIANVGAILAGGIASGIYATNGAEATWYVANHSESVIAVAEDAEQAAKFIATRARLPHLKTVVQWTGELPANNPDGLVVSWADFLRRGDGVPAAALQERVAFQKPGHCCTLIYTSGTTGNPKAVMLSHDNITWTATASLSRIPFAATDKVVSYLPLSHIAAQIIDLYLPMVTGASVSYATPDALKGSLVDTLCEVRPTIFFGVPRVWEKIEEKMKTMAAGNGFLKQWLGSWAKGVGLQGNVARVNGEPLPWGFSLAEKLVFSNVKKALGLDQARLCATAAAPISRETLEYFLSLDVMILEIYGMSESTGPHTINMPDNLRLFTVGSLFPGAFQKLDNPDAKGNGEICCWGRHIFMGYLKAEEATAATIDAEGYLHSGDLGRCDADGFLSITGRIKELLITAGGENVAPVPIEDALKAELPPLSNVVVIGDKRKFLSAVLTFKTGVDANENPNGKLAELAVNWFRDNGVEGVTTGTTVAEARAMPAVQKLIAEGVARANKAAVSQAQRVQRWCVLDNDFAIVTDELTPTMKVKRRVIVDKFAKEIEGMYAEGDAKLPAKL